MLTRFFDFVNLALTFDQFDLANHAMAERQPLPAGRYSSIVAPKLHLHTEAVLDNQPQNSRPTTGRVYCRIRLLDKVGTNTVARHLPSDIL